MNRAYSVLQVRSIDEDARVIPTNADLDELVERYG